jgi:putative lipase involved disintegration of autophagic bodies
MTSATASTLTDDELDNAINMANLSARVYDDLWDEALDVIAPLLFTTLDFEGNTLDYELIETYDDNWDGFDAQLFYNEDQDTYVLVFRGTEALSISDWLTDLTQTLTDYIDLDVTQYQQAVTIAQELQETYGDSLQFTGHSLGGGLAMVAGLATGLQTTCFEAAGVTASTLTSLGISDDDIAENQGAITHFNLEYDPLSDFDGEMNNEAPFYNTLQYGGATYWLNNVFGIGGLLNPFRVINHFYHAVVYQISGEDFL